MEQSPRCDYDRNERFEKDRAVHSEIMDGNYVHAALDRALDEGHPALQQLVTEFAWGTVCERPGLDRK